MFRFVVRRFLGYQPPSRAGGSLGVSGQAPPVHRLLTACPWFLAQTPISPAMNQVGVDARMPAESVTLWPCSVPGPRHPLEGFVILFSGGFIGLLFCFHYPPRLGILFP